MNVRCIGIDKLIYTQHEAINDMSIDKAFVRSIFQVEKPFNRMGKGHKVHDVKDITLASLQFYQGTF